MFGEKNAEYSNKQGKEVPVWQSPKYLQSKEKALEAMKTYPFLKEGDFWILMNETKSGKMAYTGLIISHNACLKINDNLPAAEQFKPECVAENQNGYHDSLVYTYCCPEQGLFEVGEVNGKNCKNDYPYAMAFKRLFDRVVLKQCKLAYDGIYSDSEAEEFKEQPDEERAEKPEPNLAPVSTIKRGGASLEQLDEITAKAELTKTNLAKLMGVYGAKALVELTMEQANAAIDILNEKLRRQEERNASKG